MTDAVAIPNEEYSRSLKYWNLTATLRAGTEAMRAAGKDYLPQENDETPKSYENRLRRSVLTNLYKKTADKLTGKPLKKPIIVEEDVPSEIKALLDDIDSVGTRLDVFAKQVFQQAVDDGVTHILVEFPNANAAAQDIGEFRNMDGTRSLSLRQAKDLNVRPYARHIKAEDVIGWKYEVIDGRKTLTQVRVFEWGRSEGEDEFSQVTRERVRVLERDQWRLYEKHKSEKQGADEWVLIEQGTNTLGEIAWTTLYTNKTGFMLGRPWLEDIAWLNVAHWQSDSDQRNLLHLARVPILFAKGFGDDDSAFSISIGSNSFVKAPSSADLKYVEHSGKGIEAGRLDLKDIEERIQQMGLEMLIKRPTGNTTATARALDQAEADSALGMVSQELENALTEVLNWFARWLEMGEEGGGSLTVFKDFGIESADAADIDILLKAKQAGEISQVTFLKEIKRRGLLSDDFDPQKEIDLLDIEGAGSASIIEEDDIDPLTGEPTGEPKEQPGRNQVGDVTSEDHGHRHTLEENGKMSTEIDDQGNSHTHTWDEFAVQTSVDAGHSHTLLTRSAATKGEAPAIPPPGAGDEEGGNQPPNLAGSNDDEGDDE